MFFHGLAALVGPGHARPTRLLDHTDLDTTQSVGLLWTSDQPVAENCT
jgi:hypothetical protein